MLSNLFDNIPNDLQEEQFIDLIKNEQVRIERIVSTGHTSPEGFWYDQAEHEFVIVLEGHAIVEFEDHEMELKRGDFLNIEAHQKHRVKYTDTDNTTVWLAVFYKQ
ncbi:cupin domain-containing protein [Candidatus Albibeggiatoa sp. nov. NOAA]|uniref:cupin domain-containing protein n=1 Tax=Candidatus Albibeggiatoa sp. nov. NOAA TaxID=3162724 RepID=UPI0032F6FEA8|nr:cupin domain-containing protein [Thiotrichaceae bacterium]